MATITEMVEAEAARAETEEPDPDAQTAEDADEDEPEDEPEDEDEEPEARAPELPAFDERKLEQELRRHEKAMEKLLGPGWPDMEPCEACGSAGFVPRSQVTLPDVKEDPDVVVCEACNGWGSRKTPSLVEGYAARTCSECSGQGFRERSQLAAIAAASAYHSQPPAQPAGPVSPPPLYWDAQEYVWKRPDGQPVYGLEPPT